MKQAHPNPPQWTTGSRLLRLGESIEFSFRFPPGAEPGTLTVFPRYLEEARPGRRFRVGGEPHWVDRLAGEPVPLAAAAGQATVVYRPQAAGSYLARWEIAGETLYRYFAAIEDDYVVLRFSAFEHLEAEPTLHGTGIPLDYRLPAARFQEDDPLFGKLLDYHRRFGDTIIPALPDTPQMTVEERVAAYGQALAKVRAVLIDPADGRTARLEMRHELDPGYTETFMRLGINDHCGLNEANARPWLGMPEFPYFASPLDCRKADQTGASSVVAHQWDFCGGWHFIGPVSWHYKAAEGDWGPAERCIRQGLAELANAARLSGHPIFAVPLYDGVVGAGYPNPAFRYELGDPRTFAGAVGEVFIAGRALGPGEVAAVMDTGPAALADALAIWRLDEGNGTVIHDASGHGHHGALVNGSRWVEGRRGGCALAFDGEDDSAATGAPVAIGTEDFTLGCWVRPDPRQRPWANLLSSHNNGTGRAYRGISIEQDGEHANRFYLIAGAGDHWVGQTVTTQLTADAWQHFAVVRQGTTLTHYLNGKVSAQGTVPAGVLPRATDPFRIGNWARGEASRAGGEGVRRFVERYQRLVAFELPKQQRVVYARSIDVADYYRRHFSATPRTVFVSSTEHLLYDRWWLCSWCNENLLVPRARLPWDTRTSSILRLRDTAYRFKDPLSCEYVLVEDQQRSIRFERECATPIWWFDYVHQERGPAGSASDYVRTPDVEVERPVWVRDKQGWSADLTLHAAAEFPDYAICLWGLPAAAKPSPERILTNAKAFALARNLAGEYHLVVYFDLKPQTQLRVTLRH